MKVKIGTHYLLFLCLIFLLSACDQFFLAANSPESAENDNVPWEGRKIIEWRWDLRHFRDVKKCSRAKDALVRAGRLAVPGLAKDVNDGSVFYVNVWAAMALFQIGSDAHDAIPALESAIKRAQEKGKHDLGWRNFEPWGRAAIVRIKNDPGGQITKIISFLEDTDDLVRSNAIKALGNLGGLAIDAVPALKKHLNDKDESVRQRAKEAIEAIEKEKRITTSVPPLPPGWKIYRNDEYGFQFYYPEGWKKFPSEHYPPGVVVAFDVLYGPNLSVLIESASGMNIEEYVDKARENILPSMGVDILGEKYLVVNERRAYKWIVRQEMRGVRFKVELITFVVNDKRYIVTLTVPENAYGQHVDTFNKIISSFIIYSD